MTACVIVLLALAFLRPTAVVHASPSAAREASRPLLPPSIAQPAGSSSYRRMIAAFRRSVGAPPVSILAVLDARSRAAATCIVRTGQDTDLHAPRKSLACAHAVSWALAARGAGESLMATDAVAGSARVEVMRFAESPFHSLALADPTQTQMGFGASSGSSPSADTRFAVAIDVTGGHYADRDATSRLMAWPASGWRINGSTSAGQEWPDPVTACGLSVAGPAMWFARPGSSSRLVVTGLRLTTADGHRVATSWCRLSSTTRAFTDPQASSTARGWLSWMNAVVVLPSAQLDGTYVLSAHVDGHLVHRHFTAVPSSP